MYFRDKLSPGSSYIWKTLNDFLIEKCELYMWWMHAYLMANYLAYVVEALSYQIEKRSLNIGDNFLAYY